MSTPAAAIQIKADSIFMHSVVEVQVSSEGPFQLKLSGRILTVKNGRRHPTGAIEPVIVDGAYVVRVETLDWFSERRLKDIPGNGPDSTYGMRFFPFVSSFLKGRIEVDLPVECLVVDLPDDFRLIWYGAKVVDARRTNASLTHSFAPQRSRFIFSWSEPQVPAPLSVEIPVRLGGAKLLRITYYPLYYWMLALAGVALSTIPDSSTVFMAAMVAVWSFMLRQWALSEVPQRNVLLTHLYQGVGALTVIWGLTWRAFGPWALAGAPLLAALAYAALFTLGQFSNRGDLPRGLARYWSKAVSRADTRQMEVWLGPGDDDDGPFASPG